MLPLNGSFDKVMKSGRTRKLAPKENNKLETRKLTAENPPCPQVLELESEESDLTRKMIVRLKHVGRILSGLQGRRT